MKRLLLTFVALPLGILAASAQTAPPISADSVIGARQAGYELLAANMASLKAVVDQGLDPKGYDSQIKAIVNWGHTIPVLFPVGTEQGHNTAAKPEIWSDRAGFEKAAGNFTAAAEKLQQVAATGDKDAFKAQFGATGATCGACHRAYRVNKP